MSSLGSLGDGEGGGVPASSLPGKPITVCLLLVSLSDITAASEAQTQTSCAGRGALGMRPSKKAKEGKPKLTVSSALVVQRPAAPTAAPPAMPLLVGGGAGAAGGTGKRSWRLSATSPPPRRCCDDGGRGGGSDEGDDGGGGVVVVVVVSCGVFHALPFTSGSAATARR